MADKKIIAVTGATGAQAGRVRLRSMDRFRNHLFRSTRNCGQRRDVKS